MITFTHSLVKLEARQELARAHRHTLTHTHRWQMKRSLAKSVNMIHGFFIAISPTHMHINVSPTHDCTRIGKVKKKKKTHTHASMSTQLFIIKPTVWLEQQKVTTKCQTQGIKHRSVWHFASRQSRQVETGSRRCLFHTHSHTHRVHRC